MSTEIEGLVSLLGEKIMSSDAIEIVSLPEMVDLGVPRPEQLGAFVERLKEALSLQIERVRQGVEIDPTVREEVGQYAWTAIAEKIESIINGLSENPVISP